MKQQEQLLEQKTLNPSSNSEPPLVLDGLNPPEQLALDTIVIGNSIKYYFLVFLPSFVILSLLSLKALGIFYETFPTIHFLIPLAIWLFFFVQFGLNLARFIIDVFVVKKSGRVVLSEDHFSIDGELIDIKKTKKIVFHYMGDEFWKYPRGISVLFGLNKRHRQWLISNPKELYDYIEIDGTPHYMKIRNKKDKHTFFKMSKQINLQQPRLAFLIKKKR